MQLSTDHNIRGHEALASQISGVVEAALIRFGGQVQRVVVHLSDENSATKVGNLGIRCVMLPHLDGLAPLAVTDLDATVGRAIDGAARTLSKLIQNTLGQPDDTARRAV